MHPIIEVDLDDYSSLGSSSDPHESEPGDSNDETVAMYS